MISPTVLMLIAAGLALFLAVLSILIGVLGASRGQRAVYYAIRRQAQQQASRRYVFAFWCVLFAGVLFGITRVLPSDSLTEADVPVQTAAPLVTANVVVDTAVADMNAMPTAAESVADSAAEPATALSAELDAATVLTTPIPSPIVTTAEVITPAATLTSPVTDQIDTTNAPVPPVPPTPTLAVIDIEPLPTATAEPAEPAGSAEPAPTEADIEGGIEPTPATEISSTAEVAADPANIVVAPNQQLSLRAIGTGWQGTDALEGVNTEFAVGTPVIYVFFNFWNVPRGSLLRHTWLQDGKTVSFSSVTFNELGQGTQAVSWAPKGGFQAGLYEVRVSLGDTPQFVANFLVQ